jgi:hypothetical protein
MFRKLILQLVIGLLVTLPLLGVLSKDVSAASSRVAIIKEMKGTVKVKKAGGSKEFTAFAKMSLNEGDILSTGLSSSVSLQFANGTSEDDKMAVSPNTTLTFSKMKNSKGTSTKVSMFNGSAWVDVKSITSKDDEFSLETPTAVMGVRGTHLLVTVDPDTGATHLTVAAGVVNASSKDVNGSSANSMNVYPTQNALFTENKSGDSEITIAPVDLELLMKQSDSSIVQAILENAAAILAENELYVKQYENNGVPENLGDSKEDLARFKSNTSNLIGAIADQAVKSGLLTQERLDQIIEKIHNQSGISVDLTKKELQLTDEEQKQQEAQRLKDEEAKQQTEERKKQEEADRKKQEETLKKLNDERKAKEEANKKAAEEQKKKAQEVYEKQLSDAEKTRFNSDMQKRKEEQAPTPTPTPTTTTAAPTLNGLQVLDAVVPTSEIMLTPSFASTTTEYSATVPNNVTGIKVKPIASETTSTVKVGTDAVSSGNLSGIIGLNVGVNQIAVVVTGQNGLQKTYTITVIRNAERLLSSILVDYAAQGDVWQKYYDFINPALSYTTSFQYDLKNLRFKPTPSQVNSILTFKVNGVGVAAGSDGYYYVDLLETGIVYEIAIDVVTPNELHTVKYVWKMTRNAPVSLPYYVTHLDSVVTNNDNVSTNLEWVSKGYGVFSKQVGADVKSMTMTMELDSYVTSAELKYYSDSVEVKIPITRGVAIPIENIPEGTRYYNLALYHGTDQVGGSLFYLIKGSEKPEWTALSISASTTDLPVVPITNISDRDKFIQVPSNTGQLLLKYNYNGYYHVTVNGKSVYRSNWNDPTYHINLNEGSNQVFIEVTDWSKLFTRTYSIMVNKGSLQNTPPPELTLTTFNGRDQLENLVRFSKDTTIPLLWNGVAEPDASYVDLSGQFVDGAAYISKILNSAGAEVTSNGTGVYRIPLNNTGTTTVSVWAMKNGISYIYYLNLTRKSISIRAPILTLAEFDPNIYTYTKSVANSVYSVQITPVAANSSIVVKVNGVTQVNGTPSDTIPLLEGLNTITVSITQNSITIIYNIIVHRAFGFTNYLDLGVVLHYQLLSTGSTAYSFSANRYLDSYWATALSDYTNLSLTTLGNYTTSLSGAVVNSVTGAVYGVPGDNLITLSASYGSDPIVTYPIHIYIGDPSPSLGLGSPTMTYGSVGTSLVTNGIPDWNVTLPAGTAEATLRLKLAAGSSAGIFGTGVSGGNDTFKFSFTSTENTNGSILFYYILVIDSKGNQMMYKIKVNFS